MGAYQDIKDLILEGIEEGVSKTLGIGDMMVVSDEVAEKLLDVRPTREQMGWLIFGGEIRAVIKVGNIAPNIWHVHTRKDN